MPAMPVPSAGPGAPRNGTAAPGSSDHLEIETYTWDVLPEHLKTGDIVDYVSREIDFVRAN